MAGIVCIGCSARVNAFPAPDLPDALPPLPGDTAWLLPVDFQEQPLVIQVTSPWLDYDNAETTFIDVKFILDDDDDPVAVVRKLPPFDASRDFPVRVSIPSEKFNTPGFKSLKFRVAYDDANDVESAEVVLEIDHRAPNGDNAGAPLIFPADVIQNGVTEDWLADNDDELPVTVPRWPAIEIGDKVLFFWGTPFEHEPVAVLEITAAHLPDGALISFAYPGDVLREKGNGTLNGFYRLSDRAGNLNPESPPVPIDVIDLPAIPDTFPAPVVPLASTDRLIDLDDARTGVTVEVGEIAEASAGDTVQCFWNDRPLPLVTLPASPQWPLSLAVSWDILSGDGFAAPVACEVKYHWQRGAAPGKDSPVTRFTVDLSVAGPDPEHPDPINPALDLVVVKGQTGDNVLLAPDRGLDARIVLRLYDNPKAGETLELHWGDHPTVVDSYRVMPTDQPGQQIEFTVSWAVIGSVGNGQAVPTWYWVSNGVNRQRSRDTLVRVSVLPLEGLEQVSFPDASIYNYIACEDEPWNGIRVKVPGNADLLEAGDEVVLSWQLSRGTLGNDPITEHVLFAPHTLTVEEARDGVILLMDRFVDLVLPLQLEDGSANVTYHLTKADGTSGFAPNKVLKISLVIPGNPFPCDGTKKTS